VIRLSVNVNKVATLRNSRGGTVPRVLDAVLVCVEAGAPGITVHPRGDRRHITSEDVSEIAAYLHDRNRGQRPASAGPSPVEFNIEGDPRPELLDLVREVRPDQCTLVPVAPGEITSQAGWQPGPATDRLRDVIADLRARSIRVSLFVDPVPDAIRWAAQMGADRVELYTEPFARACQEGLDAGRRLFRTYVDSADLAHSLGLGVNAGHDLDLENLTLFRTLPYLDEVSIGHALISRALFTGLSTVVRDYLDVLAGAAASTGRML
jgi:pyridoxine 5-phosphate synthase